MKRACGNCGEESVYPREQLKGYPEQLLAEGANKVALAMALLSSCGHLGCRMAAYERAKSAVLRLLENEKGMAKSA